MGFLDINRVSDFEFESDNLWCPFPSYAAFGGQLSAQSLAAGLLTLPDEFFPTLVHTIFVNPGDPSLKIKYQVENLRDGRHLSMRKIKGIQNDKLICLTIMSASIKDSNPKGFRFYQERLIPDNYIQMNDYIFNTLHSNTKDTQIKNKDLLKKQFNLLIENLGLLNDTFNVELGTTINNRRQVRITILKEIVDKKEFSLLMTLASDLLLVESALIALNLNFFSKELYKACSIDHNINFFKREIPKSKIVYYIVKCDNVVESKAMIEGKLVDEDGEVLCTTSQQALIRIKE
ncbi:Acyl-CoA thioesterase 2 [Nosema bombycis CQ1]|uniref:Acyl-CoA thioesterase 2 n=1 Tax=Nosema bombycis (strain CQ1 / CVCC 102059) TaxID=578461 RepID=R0KMP7_NOSB1|nr:Acyl-CoA thioesterase 2 [Nosema bombycis CQ1]|eukprot:EOB11387.1 Acyl-CoA thioesterase 2 [Nosema bombycis CQ1]